MADDTGPRAPRWPRELAGWTTALAIAVVAVAVVASSARSELLFRDGDSLVTTLVVRSLASGQAQDWALSTVLFLPEIAVLAMLSALGLGAAATLGLAAVVNLLALYGALRAAAGSAARTPAPVAGALLGFTAFAVLAATEASPSRDALEPASLLLTTTYYSATVVAAVLVVGVARRGVEAPARRWPAWTAGAVAAASVLTNPLFAAWAVFPVVLVLAVVAIRTPRSRGAARWLIVALAAGSAAGFAGRIPLARLIANTGAGYADPSQWLASAGYYAGLVAERWTGPGGIVGIILGLLLFAWCLAATVVFARRGDVGPAVVAACGWLMPVLVVIGAVVLGTHAARYLQPIAFGPVLGLVVLPALVRNAASPRVAPVVTAIAAAGALVLAGGIAVPRITTAAQAPDADLDCVVAWTDASGRTGAGQFWTVRLPKAHLADPARLVQVDHELRGYAWLVNREDFAVGEVSFLVLDDQTVTFALPGGVTMADAELVDCGRYTIADFGDRGLPLGPQRS
ncbi:hypothetical protein [Microbacterium sulfonylureivorans]|uniref:hypothetical protein n=1 Tax=Microbacterium sulfonylureivorans TaxID=2486854 RepID=UPI000FD8BC54|nr:hypothetical protein [Microbacterium sulfonylureivorans]